MYCHILRVRAIPTLESTDSMIIVARSVSLATHWQCYVCTADSVIAMIELAHIVLYSGM